MLNFLGRVTPLGSKASEDPGVQEEPDKRDCWTNKQAFGQLFVS